MKIKTSELKSIIKQVVRESLEERANVDKNPAPKQNSGQKFLKKLEEAGYKIVSKTTATNAAQNKARTIQTDPKINEVGSPAEDPDKDEMMEFLRTQFGNEEGFDFDAEAAIYWFANHYHGGQATNLYSVLSTSQFRPGAISRGPEPGSSEEMMYDSLVSQFGGSNSGGVDADTYDRVQPTHIDHDAGYDDDVDDNVSFDDNIDDIYPNDPK